MTATGGPVGPSSGGPCGSKRTDRAEPELGAPPIGGPSAPGSPEREPGGLERPVPESGLATAVAAGTVIDAEGLHYRELNARIRAAVGRGERSFRLLNVRGQRYIGVGLPVGVEIAIEGVPGNDLACFMAGARITVNGNAQDGVGNTMEEGTVVVRGSLGDLPGYAMRGGRIFVSGDAGYRVGIHMKEYRASVPSIVIGGRVQDYLGEYMAGGTIVVLGMTDTPTMTASAAKPAEFIGTGMHGGEIWIRGPVQPWQVGAEVGAVKADAASWASLAPLLAEFCRETGVDGSGFNRAEFTRLKPVSLRPYGRIYVY